MLLYWQIYFFTLLLRLTWAYERTRIKENKPKAPFSSHLKDFTKTLHFHSPAAYQIIRQNFLKCLPCIDTLNKWYSSKDYKPGISKEIISHVSEMVQKELKKR